MKKLNITKEAFEKSKYFKNKYGTLEYVSESGKVFKTNKGKILMFKEGFKDIMKSAGNLFKNYTLIPATLPKKGDICDMWHYYNELDSWEYSSQAIKKGEPVWKCEVIDRSMSKTNATIVIELKSIRNKDAKHRNLKVGDCMAVYNTRKDYLPVHFIVDKIDESIVHMHYPTEEELKKFIATKEQRMARGLIDPEDMEDTENLISTSESTKKFGKKFAKESSTDDIYCFYEWLKNNTQYDSGIHVHYFDNEDGSETVELRFDDRYQWDDEVEAGNKSKEDDSGVQDWIRLLEKRSFKNRWAFDIDEYDGEFIISVRSPNAEDDM